LIGNPLLDRPLRRVELVADGLKPVIERLVVGRAEELAAGDVRDVLERLRDTPSLSDLPVVVFTGKELSSEEDARLHTLARSVVAKGR
jgi:CheY-like chemotaxis protein